MSKATILEESENLKLERIATVRTARGDEYLINLDQLAITYADQLSDERNDLHFGWNLSADLYADNWKRLKGALDK